MAPRRDLSLLLARLRGAGRPASEAGFARLQVAVVVLLVEAAHTERVASAGERSAIVRIVRERFGLAGNEAARLIALAEGQYAGTLQDWAFTNAIRTGFGSSERRAVIEMLWEVVYADGQLVQLREALMQRLAGQLGIGQQALEAERELAFARVALSHSSDADLD